jgi:hypothetical protein
MSSDRSYTLLPYIIPNIISLHLSPPSQAHITHFLALPCPHIMVAACLTFLIHTFQVAAVLDPDSVILRVKTKVGC